MDIHLPDRDDLDQAPEQGNIPLHEVEQGERDPNDLRKGDEKEYPTKTCVILDAPEWAPVYTHVDNESLHKRICRELEIFARDNTDFEVVKICLDPNGSEADFLQSIYNVMAGKTKRDLIIFHYHGSAGGVDEHYKWHFQGGPNGGVNAYNFLGMLCRSDPDSMVLLDCYVHDKIEKMWKLRTGNVELVTLPCKLQDGAGRIIHANDGYVTESVCRNLSAWRINIMELDRKDVDKLRPRSIPQVWAKDYTIKSKTTRIWFSRTRKGSEKLCLRFRMDPKEVKRTGRISFKSYCIGPPRPPPVPVLPAIIPSEDCDEDEGVADMEDENALFMPGN